MRCQTWFVVPVIVVAMLPAVALSQRSDTTDSVQSHSPGNKETCGGADGEKHSVARPNWMVKYVSGSLGLKPDQWLKIAFVSRLAVAQIADASVSVPTDQLVAIEFNANAEKKSDLLQRPRSGCSYAKSMMPDTSQRRPEVLVATAINPGPVSRLAEKLEPKHAIRFVWNDADERRLMMLKVHDCEYESLIANVRWIMGSRWKEIAHELK